MNFEIECHGQRSPVNEALPLTAPSREDIMYQGPGGCIVGKYNIRKKRCLQSRFSAIVWNAQSRDGWAAKVCQAADNCDLTMVAALRLT